MPDIHSFIALCNWLEVAPASLFKNSTAKADSLNCHLTPQTAYEYNHDFESTAVAKPTPTQTVEPEIAIKPEPDVESEPLKNDVGYIDGSCKSLKAQGLGPFYPGDANYTSKRDRDSDGIACE